VGGGVGGDGVEHLIGALGIGDRAAVDPLGGRDRVGGRQPRGGGVNEPVQRLAWFGNGGGGQRADQQRPGHQQDSGSIAAHHPIMLSLSG
jgi:hypothetical protein